MLHMKKYSFSQPYFCSLAFSQQPGKKNISSSANNFADGKK